MNTNTRAPTRLVPAVAGSSPPPLLSSGRQTQFQNILNGCFSPFCPQTTTRLSVAPRWSPPVLQLRFSTRTKAEGTLCTTGTHTHTPATDERCLMTGETGRWGPLWAPSASWFDPLRSGSGNLSAVFSGTTIRRPSKLTGPTNFRPPFPLRTPSTLPLSPHAPRTPLPPRGPPTRGLRPS